MKAPPASPNQTLPDLRSGSRGDEVRILQSALSANGFYSDKVDGIFGPVTERAVAYFQQTHIGKDKRYLSATSPAGIVDQATWAAILSGNPADQRSYLDTHIPLGLSNARRQVLRCALKDHQDGVREVPDGANYGDGVTKYLAGIGPAYWCCYAVSWWFKTATGHYPFDERFGLCRALWNEAKRRGQTYQANPVPGDAFVILYRKNGQLTGAGHIGLVGCVDDDAEQFGTLAGNEGNRVKASIRQTDEPLLAGFVDIIGDKHDVQAKFKRGLFKIGAASSNDFGATR